MHKAFIWWWIWYVAKRLQSAAGEQSKWRQTKNNKLATVALKSLPTAWIEWAVCVCEMQWVKKIPNENSYFFFVAFCVCINNLVLADFTLKYLPNEPIYDHFLCILRAEASSKPPLQHAARPIILCVNICKAIDQQQKRKSAKNICFEIDIFIWKRKSNPCFAHKRM